MYTVTLTTKDKNIVKEYTSPLAPQQGDLIMVNVNDIFTVQGRVLNPAMPNLVLLIGTVQ